MTISQRKDGIVISAIMATWLAAEAQETLQCVHQSTVITSHQFTRYRTKLSLHKLNKTHQ